MYCHKCGVQIAEGATFCHSCGTKVVYESAEPQKSSIISDETQVKAPNRKALKPVKLLIFIVILIALFSSGIFSSIVDTLIGINDEIENRADGTTLVPDMQSPNDLFPTGGDSASVQSTESSFAWVEDPHMVTEDDIFKTRYIVGEIQNISDISFTSASVQFILYDAAGNQVDTTSDVISNFKAGNTWKFKASVLSDDVAYFEFAHATKAYPKE